eukprot:1781269-Rhodomonas_salina.2
METSLQAYPEMDHVAVESSKKNFLHTWSEYIENLKKATEMSERQMHLSKYEGSLATHCQHALAALNNDPSTLPVTDHPVNWAAVLKC